MKNECLDVKSVLEQAAALAIKFTAAPRDLLGPTTTAMKMQAALGEKLAAAIRGLDVPAASMSCSRSLEATADRWRCAECELFDAEKSEWRPCQFIGVSISTVLAEPIVQERGRMPVFATWGSVRGLPKDEILAHYRSPKNSDDAAAVPVQQVKPESTAWTCTRNHDLGAIKDSEGYLIAQPYFAEAKVLTDRHNASIGCRSAVAPASVSPPDVLRLRQVAAGDVLPGCPVFLAADVRAMFAAPAARAVVRP